ncbi:uncharacterized protein BDV17DRAFT_118898 [Aspergillus undulatus]|uniref:uncharacterized protein n=1 Tax=Aspergillus undulatus TaxID=1810928 RepID=UPI003CCD92CF
MHFLLVFLRKIPILVVFFYGTLFGIRSLSSRFQAAPPVLDKESSDVSLSEKWQVLGPFPCGTREAVWGADPLELRGGFTNLSFDQNVEIPSPLATGGIVRWGVIASNTTNAHPKQSRAELVLAFPQIDWTFLQSIYGWSALQYQAWARGHLHLPDSRYQSVAIYTDGILEIVVDGRRHFGGDFYSYRRAPLILNLTPGGHVVELRLVRDVRALGGQGDPTVKVVLEAEIRYDLLTVDEQSLLVPESTDWKLGSTWSSINIQNNGAEWIDIISLNCSNVCFRMVMEAPLHLAPYQTRPLAFRITADSLAHTGSKVKIHYRISQDETIRTQSFHLELIERSLTLPQRLTYLHPAGVVSFSILRPPSLDSPCVANHSTRPLPIIIGLHGAGLEADSEQVRGMLDAAYGICAWMLFPSGVTSWSGDDWHTWGVADIRAAVGAMREWIGAVGWSGPGILADEWVVVGHSNGGQGVWFLTTHYPDTVIAAAPVSGYTSIENYVPYNMWRDSEPLISSILHESRASFKHELLLANVAGIPILQQHGSDDANVPAYHSRLMHALLGETGWSSDYVELPGKGHWFDGVMTTAPLLDFYENSVRSMKNRTPSNFEMYVPSSGDMASKGGIYVDQLQSPDFFGRLHVRTDAQQGIWHVQTKNINRFHLLSKTCRLEGFSVLMLDDTDDSFHVDPSQCESTWYIRNTDGRWTSSRQTQWQSVSQRYGRQVGAMDAILRTHGVFTINPCSDGIERLALQIGRNLFQYFSADSYILGRCGLSNETSSGNVITLSLGDGLPKAASPSYPIRVTDDSIMIYKECFLAPGDLYGELGFDVGTRCREHIFDHEPAMGALFLRPLGDERLELVVWGVDMDGLEQAARLVPTLTGAGQPEFMILGNSCRWKGHAGLYAAGHFDKFWQISAGSYLARGV